MIADDTTDDAAIILRACERITRRAYDWRDGGVIEQRATDRWVANAGTRYVRADTRLAAVVRLLESLVWDYGSDALGEVDDG